jgi:hypothetical protein
VLIAGGLLPWRPSDLGASLLGWNDASDAATITITGSGVSAWGNKGASSFALSQGNDAQRPSYANNIVTFNHTGAGQHLISANPPAAAISLSQANLCRWC